MSLSNQIGCLKDGLNILLEIDEMVQKELASRE
jgi:hypothetical protein